MASRRQRQRHVDDAAHFDWDGEQPPRSRPVVWLLLLLGCFVAGFYLGRLSSAPDAEPRMASQAAVERRQKPDASPRTDSIAKPQPQAQQQPVTSPEPQADKKGADAGAGAGKKSPDAPADSEKKKSAAAQKRPVPRQSISADAGSRRSSSTAPTRERPAAPSRSAEPPSREDRGQLRDYDDLRTYMLKQP